MSKIAVPAYSMAFRFMKKEWGGVMLLALKTYLLILLFELLAAIPISIIMGPQPDQASLENMPKSFILLNMLFGIISFFLTQWIVSPLYIAISRSVVLGKPFDRILCKHLTEKRTWRVTKLLWSIFIVMIPFYIGTYALFKLAANVETQKLAIFYILTITALVIAFLVYTIFFIYVNLRIYYLVPALAIDRPFSSIGEIWKHSKGHAWSVLKVILLGILLIIGFAILFGVGFYILSTIMNSLGNLAVEGRLIIQILIGILIFLLILLTLAVLVLYIPQLIIAAVAGVYKLSQSKALKSADLE
jgi:hypothetical protein